MSLWRAETSLLCKKEDHNFNIALIISNKTCSECTRGNCSFTFAFWEWAVNLVTAYSSEVAFHRVALYRCFRINNYSSFSKISSAICITRLTTHCTCDLMPVLVICKQEKSMIMHDTKCPHWNLGNCSNPVSIGSAKKLSIYGMLS